MAPPHETKLPEQQSSDSNSTARPTAATAEDPNPEMAEDPAQKRDELAVLIPVTHASGAEDHSLRQAGSESTQAAPDIEPAVIKGGAVDPQPHAPTGAATVMPVSGDDTVPVDRDVPTSANNPAITVALADPDQDRGEDGDSATAAAAGSGHDEATRTAPNGSERGDGEEYGSTIPTSTDFEHGRVEVERGGPAAPAFTMYGSGEEADGEPMTPVSIGFAYGEEERAGSVTATPAGSDHGDREDRGSVATASAGPGDGNREGSGSMIPVSASPDHDDADHSRSEADEGASDPVSSDIASEENAPAPSPEDPDTQSESKSGGVPKGSGAPVEATSSDTTDEEEAQDPAATPAQDDEETASEADTESDLGEYVVDLLPPEMPDSPLQPSAPLGEDPNDIDLDDGEAVCSPMDRVFTMTGYRRPEARGLGADEDEDGRINPRGLGGGGGGGGDVIPIDRAPHASTYDQPAGKAGDRDEDSSDTVHLRIQYLVAHSHRANSTLCISVPTAITLSSLTRTISTALRHHGGYDNPRPVNAEAEIARFVVVLAKKETEASDFRRVIELTEGNVRDTLTLMIGRSVYDVVKVLFEPGTNGEVRPRKAGGRVYGRLGKVGGL